MPFSAGAFRWWIFWLAVKRRFAAGDAPALQRQITDDRELITKRAARVCGVRRSMLGVWQQAKSPLGAQAESLCSAQREHHHRFLGQKTVGWDLGNFGARFVLASCGCQYRGVHRHGRGGNGVTWDF